MDNENDHMRRIMLYEFPKGAATKDIREVHLDRAPAPRTVKKWFAKFRSADFNLEDQPRSDRPSELDDDILRTLVAFHSLKKVGYTLKLDTWMPHQLSEKNKVDRMSTAISLLRRIKNEPFLDRLVTGDEKWTAMFNAKEYGNRHIWWDIRSVIYFELLPAGETITANKYCQQLVELKKAIDEKRPILANRKGVLFHYDNARPHVAKPTLA
ncbi:unnamed protein product [Ceratitis capitata]|uniref:(Mediterranean fruit fly) hypothetical protein n=1 Tax=Ceratitis capitata TaxID=7213 RepID=A0A811V026_CERCA|nr:unnamed protein product [Ceratitis capitata]